MKKLIRYLLKKGKMLPKLENPFDDQKCFFKGTESLTIFDVGAYIGQITGIYEEIFPEATIYCFEPFPDSFRKLEELSRNQKIKVYQMAVSDQVDKTKLYVNADITCNSFFPRPKDGTKYYPVKAEHIDQIRVDTITIDNFCDREQIEHIDILKIDVEGAETRVLNGARSKLSNQAISLIYTEVMFTAHYEGGCLFHELAGLLEQYGYTLFNFYNLKRAKDGQLRWGNAIFLNPQIRAGIDDIHSI